MQVPKQGKDLIRQRASGDDDEVEVAVLRTKVAERERPWKYIPCN
jgi:hypothetical protein